MGTVEQRPDTWPRLEGRARVTAAALIVAGPLAVLLAAAASATPAADTLGVTLDRLSVPLMLGWAAVLFLVTRTSAPMAAWTGLIAITVQLSALQGLSPAGLLLTIELIGFLAYAYALWRTWWVPRAVPVLMVVFPVVDVFTPEHSNLVQLLAFAVFVTAFAAVAVRLSHHGSERPPVVVEHSRTCSPYRTCLPGRTCCRPPLERVNRGGSGQLF